MTTNNRSLIGSGYMLQFSVGTHLCVHCPVVPGAAPRLRLGPGRCCEAQVARCQECWVAGEAAEAAEAGAPLLSIHTLIVTWRFQRSQTVAAAATRHEARACKYQDINIIKTSEAVSRVLQEYCKHGPSVRTLHICPHICDTFCHPNCHCPRLSGVVRLGRDACLLKRAS